MYTRILVPLDGSKTGEAVLPYVRSLARELKIPVELLTIVSIPGIYHQLHTEAFTYFDGIADNMFNAENYLASVARNFRGQDVTCTVKAGEIARTIVNKAEVDKGTLVAMATHGRSGLSRWLLGSTVKKVLRAASNSLFLVRACEEVSTDRSAMLDSVTVHLDGSEVAESILPWIIELAKAIKLKTRLVRGYYRTNILFRDELRDLPRSKNEALRYLDGKVQQLKNEGLVHVASFVLKGKPADVMIEAARGTPNGLIAMCTHGPGGVSRSFLGSVIENVVRLSGSPVLVIRAT